MASQVLNFFDPILSVQKLNKERIAFMKGILIGTALAGLTVLSAQALDVNIYSGGYSENFGVNIDFSGATLAGSFTSPAVSFGTATGFNWHPFGLADFGADVTGSVDAAGGTYHISLFSDDASYLFIDGVLQISRPGPHGPDRGRVSPMRWRSSARRSTRASR